MSCIINTLIKYFVFIHIKYISFNTYIELLCSDYTYSTYNSDYIYSTYNHLTKNKVWFIKTLHLYWSAMYCAQYNNDSYRYKESADINFINKVSTSL